MQIQTFTGATLAEALSQVKQELGEEAIILSSRRAEDPSRLPEGHVIEVVAALPAPQEKRAPRGAARAEARPWSPPRVPRDGSAPPLGLTAAGTTAPAPGVPGSTLVAGASLATTPAAAVETPPASDLLDLKGELQDLRRVLRDMGQLARYGAHQAWSGRHDQALRSLCGRGLTRPSACSLLDELPEAADERAWERALLAALARRLPCVAPGEDDKAGEAAPARRIEALVGPTGVGKTTLLAKLLLNRAGPPHRRAGILSLDTKRVAAVDQVRRLAGILRAPLELVYRPGELGASLERLAGCDLVLVDSPGTGPRERLSLERTRAFLRELKCRHIHVVVPASMRLEDQLAAIAPWRQAGADRLVVSKLDEASGLAGLVDLAAQAGLPFSYAGTGQRIPDDLARLEPALLARWILKPETLGQEGEARAEGSRRLQALVAEARLGLGT